MSSVSSPALSLASRLPPHGCIEQRGGAGHPLGTTRAAQSSGGVGASTSAQVGGGGPASSAQREARRLGLLGDIAPLVAAAIALPEIAATVPLLAVLPPAEASFWAVERAELLAPPVVVAARRAELGPPTVGGPRKEFVLAVLRQLACGMVSMRAPSPDIVINGCFTLVKTAAPLELRFIVNAQPANAAFQAPFPLALPSPEHIGRLIGKGKYFWFKRDLSNYYHQLALPQWLCRFFGLPRLTRAECLAHGLDPARPCPVLLSVPMGWLHAPGLAQLAHEWVLLPVIPPSRYIQESGAAHIGSWRAAIYIDDLGVVVPEHEVDAGVGADLQRRVDACYEAHSLGVKTAKNIDLTSSPMELIGTELRNTATGVLVLPSVKSIGKVVGRSLEFLQAPPAVGLDVARALERLLGSWAWVLLLHRPAFSFLFAAYHFHQHALSRGAAAVTVWPSVRRELVSLLAVLPLLAANWARPFHELIFASDACPSGGAVVAALHEAPWFVPPASLPWVVSRRRSWSRVEHINVLELRMALDVLHLAGRRQRGSRVFVWMDSQVALGVVRKGRSSSAALNAVARHLAVAGFLTDCLLMAAYVPTEANPADGPSRASANTSDTFRQDFLAAVSAAFGGPSRSSSP